MQSDNVRQSGDLNVISPSLTTAHEILGQGVSIATLAPVAPVAVKISWILTADAEIIEKNEG